MQDLQTHTQHQDFKSHTQHARASIEIQLSPLCKSADPMSLYPNQHGKSLHEDTVKSAGMTPKLASRASHAMYASCTANMQGMHHQSLLSEMFAHVDRCTDV